MSQGEAPKYSLSCFCHTGCNLSEKRDNFLFSSITPVPRQSLGNSSGQSKFVKWMTQWASGIGQNMYYLLPIDTATHFLGADYSFTLCSEWSGPGTWPLFLCSKQSSFHIGTLRPWTWCNLGISLLENVKHLNSEWDAGLMAFEGLFFIFF